MATLKHGAQVGCPGVVLVPASASVPPLLISKEKLNPVKKLNLVCLKVANLKGGGGEVRFPGHWLTKDGLEKELRHKARTEGRKEGPF